ncbi:serine acetyltransferase [Siphonobacter aquaeclarae]|uniref:Putative colanic acid biosynthesis acetyltransferase WcaB n=1 Tax=Siphonobacter aquaeclarae TaxID=563176 RepID=A0A1G9V6Y2_9BACT|nr:serine acetyltransferase [Siphonobacter aquaeclarae]SDM67972.1 putative colanic acid biosynthesis acetyltransferase WcaB [Siphonobacter aquaeclarae]
MFIFQDWPANAGNSKGRIFAFFFRLAALSCRGKLLSVLCIPFRIFYKVFFEWIVGAEIPFNARIGKGLKVYHLQAIVINKDVVIGENCILRQSTTIGNRRDNGGCPVIGNNVNIGAHVCILGEITIGDNVQIGAGSMVLSNIPPNSVVVGNPARILKQTV